MEHRDTYYLKIEIRFRLGNKMFQYAALFPIPRNNPESIPFIINGNHLSMLRKGV